MRIWSIHPEYLDSKGLITLWREALLAKKVLEGKTKGYKNHPQLKRFIAVEKPVEAINQYLVTIFEEALIRRYKFDNTKINRDFKPVKILVTNEQLEYERRHLLNKLKIRDIEKFIELESINIIKVHPLFERTEGEIEEWEKEKQYSKYKI